MYEWIGITGSVLIIIAFSFKNEYKIRITDAIGAVFFIIYGACIKSFSTVFLNIILIIIQAMNLWRIYKNDKRKTKD